MTNQPPPRYCLAPGCSRYAARPSAYCQEHKRAIASNRTPRPMEGQYNTAAYGRFRDSVMSCNPICQRIERGERCKNPSRILHHLKEPADVREFYDRKNACMVCEQHHTPEKGTPRWTEGVDYVAPNIPEMFRTE